MMTKIGKYGYIQTSGIVRIETLYSDCQRDNVRGSFPTGVEVTYGSGQSLYIHTSGYDNDGEKVAEMIAKEV